MGTSYLYCLIVYWTHTENLHKLKYATDLPKKILIKWIIWMSPNKHEKLVNVVLMLRQRHATLSDSLL